MEKLSTAAPVAREHVRAEHEPAEHLDGVRRLVLTVATEFPAAAAAIAGRAEGGGLFDPDHPLPHELAATVRSLERFRATRCARAVAYEASDLLCNRAAWPRARSRCRPRA